MTTARIMLFALKLQHLFPALQSHVRSMQMLEKVGLNLQYKMPYFLKELKSTKPLLHPEYIYE